MKEKRICFKNGEQEIKGILLLSNDVTDRLVIIIPGFAQTKDRPASVFKLAERLAQKNFTVLRFDFQFVIPDLNEFYKVTMKGEDDLKIIIEDMYKKYDKIGLVEESFGAPISILVYSDKIKCLVFWYPVIYHKETGFVIIKKRSTGQEFNIGKDFIEEIKASDVISKTKEILYPVLSIHGDVDLTIPFNQSERLLEILKEPKNWKK